MNDVRTWPQGQGQGEKARSWRGSGLSIGQAVEAVGLTRKTVRVPRTPRVAAPAERSMAGYRLYDDSDVELLTFICRARTWACSVPARQSPARLDFG
ncbi:MerR family transcriptional regulator [Streptomyces sp. TRM68367]|uniref:MerR family transcriptional regulator n=1 Tax=Streptomyces sp. TRM68367 TaxID=2758415 RepID=UPI001CAA0E26